MFMQVSQILLKWQMSIDWTHLFELISAAWNVSEAFQSNWLLHIHDNHRYYLLNSERKQIPIKLIAHIVDFLEWRA